MKLPFSAIVKEEEETKEIANQFAGLLQEDNGLRIVAFNGNLGTGKTTMIKYIALNFNISNVTSPSFAIVNEYYGTKKIFHFDFYRLKNVNELYDIGFEDYLNDTEAIIFIEWANLMKEILPQNRYEVNMELLENSHRKILIGKTKRRLL